MRRYLALLLMLLALAAAAAAWLFAYRHELARQWACYRIETAPSFEEARKEIAWFEQEGPDRQARLDELVGKWGAGSDQFDLYVAQHLYDSDCTDALRERFSAELSGRPDLLPRWAHWWTWRTPLPPDEEVRSILWYLDALAIAPATATITWREALGVQAVFELTGKRALAIGLTPANSLERYRRWKQERPGELPSFARPENPW